MFRKALLSLSALALVAPLAQAFELPEGAKLLKNVQVSMRDGARMNTQVYLPPNRAGQVPTILVRTPYDTEMDSRSELHERLLSEGYAIVEQHERGRYFSEGRYEMLGGSLNDGWDTMDWITAQDWSDGQVGTLGCSSSAENQLKLGAAGHPAHKAMSVQSSGVGIDEAVPFKEHGNFWRGGVWQQGWADYFLISTVQAWPMLPERLSDEERQKLLTQFSMSNEGWSLFSGSDYEAHRMHLPMVDFADAMGAPQNELKTYLEAGLESPIWNKERVSEGEKISVPGLWTEAIYDLSPRSTTAYFDWNRKANLADGQNNQAMRITQGGHCSFGKSFETEATKIGDLELGDMRWDYAGDVTRWFNRWMKPGEDTTPMPPAYTAYMGDGDWLETDHLFPASLQLSLGSDGALGSDVSEGSISFVYDPANPVIARGGEIAGVGDDQHDGAYDQREIEARDDVLVFTSDALAEPMTLFGFAEIGLSVSSDRPDTDFTVKLVDVFPDGRAFNIGDTILRMRYRDGIEEEVFMEPGKVYDIVLPPILLSRRIEAGHSLRVEVSSSNFPTYARSLNTTADPYTSTDFEIANNTVHFGDGASSFIRLPVSD